MSSLIQFQRAEKNIFWKLSSNRNIIILDCTPDASKTEQMTLIIRYISINQTEDHPRTSEIVVNESFLGFIPIEKSTGLELTETISKQLSALGLSLENIRGQGYDNGSNMKYTLYTSKNIDI